MPTGQLRNNKDTSLSWQAKESVQVFKRSLSAYVKRQNEMWERTNAARRKYQQHTRLGRLLELASGAPLTWVLAAVSLALVAMALTATWLIPPYPGIVAFGPTNECRGAAKTVADATSSVQVAECYSSANTLGVLLSVQASFIAVVYPIVVAFVTILVQRQTASKASLSAYFAVSSATLTGLSGFGLVGVVVAQLVLLDEVAPATGFAWLCADVVWFLLNLALGARFLIRTFRFATPEGRRSARDEHVLRAVWPAEASYQLARAAVLEPLKHGLHSLPDAGVLLVTDSSVGFSNRPGRLGREPFFLPAFRGKKHVVDIHYALLERAFARWSRLAEKSPSNAVVASLRPYDRRGPVLEIGVHLHQVISQLDPVFKYSNSPAPDRITSVLLRCSLSISRMSKAPAAKVADAVEEAREDVAAAMQKGSTGEFLRSLTELMDFIDEVVKCSQFKTGSGPENLVLLPDSDGTSGEVLISMWLRAIEDLFLLALSAVTRTSVFAERLVRVPVVFISRQRASMPEELQGVYIELQFFVLRRLLEWAAEHCAKASSPMRERGLLDEPLASRYEKVLGQGLGAVEQMLTFNLKLPEEARQSWKDVQRVLPQQVLHLRSTAALVVLSARGKDRLGATFALNSLLHWRNMAVGRGVERHGWGDDFKLTYMHLGLPLPGVLAEFAPTFAPAAGQAPAEAIRRAILSNLWRDIGTLVVASMLAQTGQDLEKQMLVAELAKVALLRRGLGDAQDLDEQECVVHSAEQLLQCMVRQQVLDAESDAGYQEFLDKVVGELAPSGLDKGIRGRARAFYMPSVDGLREEFLLMLSLLVSPDWRPERHMERYLRQSVNDVAQRGQLRHLLQQCLRSLEGDSLATRLDAMWRLLRPDQPDGLGEALDCVAAGLRSLLERTEGILTEALRQQPVSAATVRSLARQVSEVLVEPGRHAPLAFFRTLTALPLGREPTHKRTLPVYGWDKGSLTDPPMSYFGGSDVGILRDLMSHGMACEAMKDLARLAGIEQVPVNSRSEFVRQVAAYGAMQREASQTPVLLLQSGANPPWLFEMSVPRLHAGTEVVDFRSLPSAEGEVGYLGHIGETGVYEAPLPADHGFLCTKEMFVELRVGTQSIPPLDIQLAPEPDEEHYTLNLTWWQHPRFAEMQVLRLQFPSNAIEEAERGEAKQ